MDIRKFEVFLEVADTRSYTLAAENLFTTQGNISKQILALEKELGVTLIDRRHRKVMLTTAGDITVIYAKKIVHEYLDLQKTLQQNANGGDLVLNIHTVTTLSNYRAFELINAFHKRYPELAIHLSEIKGKDIAEILTNNDHDIVFGRDFGNFARQYDTLQTEIDEFVAILPTSHPLAMASMIDLKQLQGEDFLLMNRDSLMYNEVIKLAAEVDMTLTVAYAGKRIDILLNMIESGLGISILMDKSIEIPAYRDLIKVPLKITRRSQMSFIRSKSSQPNQAGNLFWQFMHDHVKL